MFSQTQVLVSIGLYLGLLLALALWTERRAKAGRNPVDNPLVYSLSLAVYCTAWTFFGGVGMAVSTGMLFLAVYIGPTLGLMIGWPLLLKLIRLKERHRVTSLADLLGLRYGPSRRLAALATLLTLAAITPYVALQLRSVVDTFQIITTLEMPGGFYRGLVAASGMEQMVGLAAALAMIVFTITFGARRLDPTERHPGMVMAVAAESLVKLVALLAVGGFVVWGLYQGPGGLLRAMEDHLRATPHLGAGPESTPGLANWLSLILISACAVFFLPRQFHVTVVENTSPRHLYTALWLFPLYLLLINLPVVPIAAGGLLAGYSPWEADTFVLRLPLDLGHGWLALLAYLGGFSAATAMVMVATMTCAVMVANHLLLPLAERLPGLGFLGKRLLGLRWLAVTLVIGSGYLFAWKLGRSQGLAATGIISFVAMAQFAPAVVGGLYWRRGNLAGALAGLLAGFGVWAYAMLLPVMARAGWLPRSLLSQGPWGLSFLRPEHLLGLVGLDPLSNAVFWSLLLNGGLYVIGSLLHQPDPARQRLAEEMVDLGSEREGWQGADLPQTCRLEDKLTALRAILGRYLRPVEVEALLAQAVRGLGLEDAETAGLTSVAELASRVESALAGAIGAAAAHAALDHGQIFTAQEAAALAQAYARVLADLRMPPQELKRRMDYHQAREALLHRENELLLRGRRVVEEKLEALDRLARSVAHEIRNPVVSIGGLAQRMLGNSHPQSKEARYLDKILGAVRELEKIVREVRAYADLPTPQIMAVDLGQLCGRIAQSYVEACRRTGVEMTLAGSAGRAGQVRGLADSYLLERAVKVLMDNALEAMPKGGRLTLTLTGDGQEAGITVADTGEGIPPQDLPYVFDPFFSTKAEAVGMSLALARRIAMEHLGQLTAISIPGQGTSFVLTIPLNPGLPLSEPPGETRPPNLK